jgi:hypothetical protein
VSLKVKKKYLILFYFSLKIKSKSLTHLDRIQPQINVSSSENIPYKVILKKNLILTLKLQYFMVEIFTNRKQIEIFKTEEEILLLKSNFL